MENLPSLFEPRRDHGCGEYYRQDGTQVELTGICHHHPLHIHKVFLVTAGWMDDRLSSTELLLITKTSTSSSWVQAKRFPRRVFGLRGVTLDGSLYMTG